jgi:hypothetical protein
VPSPPRHHPRVFCTPRPPLEPIKEEEDSSSEGDEEFSPSEINISSRKGGTPCVAKKLTFFKNFYIVNEAVMAP